MSWFNDIGHGFTDLFTKGDAHGLGNAVISGVKGASKIVSDPATQAVGMALFPEFAPAIATAGLVANGINNSNLI